MPYEVEGDCNLSPEFLFRVIGSPLGGEPYVPESEQVDPYFDLAFENRVGLLFLERCVDLGVVLSPRMRANYDRLVERRRKTEEVMVRLAEALDHVARGEWVLFKSIKPFPSTPNDTDWFPFDRRLHDKLCVHLLGSGFRLLEKAPLQTTLIDARGIGLTHRDKRGGIYYIDCYQIPATDYFVYLDPKKMRKHLTHRQVAGHQLPALASVAELAAIMFHNVFPEKTYTIESFYLLLHYLAEIDGEGQMEKFIGTIRENSMEHPASANLAVTAALHQRHFCMVPGVLGKLLEVFPSARSEGRNLEACAFRLPYDFSAGCFWRTFAEKLRDPVSLRSVFVQAFHMLSPIFFYDVMQTIWKRTRKGGIYKQM